ncbi:MAG: AI-2E family transporter [Ruminiclostridium sp.]|nr:AI-2E family transporter [Ruminiclostridium sp.]
MVIKEKKIITFIIICILLILGVTHYELALTAFNYIWNLFLPIVVGLVLAFILNVPVSNFERLFEKLTAKNKKKPKKKTIHIISLVLTIICILLVFTLLFTLIIPEITKTVKSIVLLVQQHWPEWKAALEEQNIDTSKITDYFANLDLQSILKKVTEGASVVIGSIANATTSTISAVSSAVIGAIIAVYVLLSRDILGAQAKKVLYAYTKQKTADKICYVCNLTKDSYSKFLTGQCLEAIILGILIFIAFTIFRLPYAPLIGFVTAVCALIPYIGAFVSCGLGVFLAFLESPEKALICLIVYLAVQFIETQFIYPYVVGGSVGLSPLWTLVSVLVGGKLFGLLGMIFFIPLVAVIYTLIKQDTNKRLEEKKLKENLKLE